MTTLYACRLEAWNRLQCPQGPRRFRAAPLQRGCSHDHRLYCPAAHNPCLWDAAGVGMADHRRVRSAAVRQAAAGGRPFAGQGNHRVQEGPQGHRGRDRGGEQQALPSLPRIPETNCPAERPTHRGVIALEPWGGPPETLEPDMTHTNSRRAFRLIATAVAATAVVASLSALPGAGGASASATTTAQPQQRSSLSTRVPNFSLEDTPLEDALDFLENMTGVGFYVDWQRLELAGVDRSTPVSIQLRGTSVRKTLSLVLDAASPMEPLT